MNNDSSEKLITELLKRTQALLEFLKNGNLLALEEQLYDRELLVTKLQQLDRQGEVKPSRSLHELTVLNQMLLDSVLKEKASIRDNLILIKNRHKATKAYDDKGKNPRN